MYYYFDESGNWSEPNREQRTLVVGGVQVDSEKTMAELEQDLRVIMADRKLKHLHACDLAPGALTACYQAIGRLLRENRLRAMMHVHCPGHVRHASTLVTPEEAYRRAAATLVATMIFNDSKPQIYYDLTFYQAYPGNVVKHMHDKLPPCFKHLDKYMRIDEQAFESLRKELVDRLKSLKDKKTEALRKQLAGLCVQAQSEEEAHSKIRQWRQVAESRMKQYLITRARLIMEGSDIARELFKTAITDTLQASENLLQAACRAAEVKVIYLPKEAQMQDKHGLGVATADLLCNLVYRGANNGQAGAVLQQLVVQEITS